MSSRQLSMGYSRFVRCSRLVFLFGLIGWLYVQFLLHGRAPMESLSPAAVLLQKGAGNIPNIRQYGESEKEKLDTMGKHARDVAAKVLRDFHNQNMLEKTETDILPTHEMSLRDIPSRELYLPSVNFFNLSMCSPLHGVYECLDNHDCAKRICRHPRRNNSVAYFKTQFPEFASTSETRRNTWKQILHRMEGQYGKNDEKALLVLIVNAGFVHMFSNFHCSLKSNLSPKVLDHLKRRTIVLTSDANSFRFVNETLKWFSPSPEEFQILAQWTRRKIMEIPAVAFGRGSHGSLNMILKFATSLDLISFGYRVMIQDVDVVWKGNAFETLLKTCPLESSSTCDFAFIEEMRLWTRSGFSYEDSSRTPFDERWMRKPEDSLKELNTGLFLVNPTKLAFEVLKTIIQGDRLQRWKGRDQPLFNSVLYHEHFTRIKISLLSIDQFIPGKRLHSTTINRSPIQWKNVVAVHISDTGSYLTKLNKMRTLNLWYFDNPVCFDEYRRCEEFKPCVEPMTTLYRNGTKPKYLDELDPDWVKTGSLGS